MLQIVLHIIDAFWPSVHAHKYKSHTCNKVESEDIVSLKEQEHYY